MVKPPPLDIHGTVPLEDQFVTDQSMSQWDNANKNTVAATNITPTMNSWRKPNLVIDFDGVIHSYERGWQGGEIYGTIVPGFWEWADKAKEHFTLIIYSSRSSSHKTRTPMEDWLGVHLWSWKLDNPDSKLDMKSFEFLAYKPPAFIMIDDRALTFNGKWNDPKFDPEELLKFKPWNQQV